MTEHQHNHTHEHAGEHGHEHTHAHERNLSLEHASVTLSSHMHEQAATVSATINLAPGVTARFSQVSAALLEIATLAEAAGGIVGHVKAFAETARELAHASCTDARLGVSAEGDPNLALDCTARIQLVAIIMLIDLDELERIVTRALAAL